VPERAHLDRLKGAVTAIAGDPVLRRALRYRPDTALAELRLSGPPPPSLPVRHRGLSVWLDRNTMFGSADVSCSAPVLPLDVRLLIYGARELALVHVQQVEAEQLVSWACSRGFPAALSPRAFTPRRDDTKAGFADLAETTWAAAPGAVPPGAWRGALVGATWDAVILGWLALAFGWDEYLGVLLGYPRCCATSFAARWRTAVADHAGDLALATALDAPGEALEHALPWQTNAFARYTGPSILAHFPCTLECEATVDVVDRAAATLELHEPALATELQARLEAPVVATPRDGVFVFPGAAVDDVGATRVLRYDPSLIGATATDSDFTEAVRGASELEASDGTVRVGVVETEGRLLAFSDLTTRSGRDAVLVGP
jgi:hypothetical protein